MYLYQIFIVNILWILGFNALFHSDHILNFVERWAATRKGLRDGVIYTALRPFAFCVECMSSVHGAAVYVGLSFSGFHTFSLLLLPFYCILLLGCINLVCNYLNYLNRN